MNVDYMIVGCGLAGMVFACELEKNNKTFVIYENSSQNSSLVAAGVYNPVVLKRFTPVWDVSNQLEIALPFYAELENKFQKKYDYKVPIYRILKSVEEQNNWFVACDKPVLEDYLESKLSFEKFRGVESPFGFGKLKNTGRIDTLSLLKDFKKYLQQNQRLISENFQHSLLNVSKKAIKYLHIKASKIVFCEGFGLKQNKYFNNLPMEETKGELITIYSPELNVDVLLKAAVFVLPLGNNYFKVGATFNWNDKTNLPTPEGESELIKKLETIITVPYKIVSHQAGIRPTVNDRRPLVGSHSAHDNVAVLNGLGTRGVMLAPKLAKELFQHLEFGKELSEEIDINRFSLK